MGIFGGRSEKTDEAILAGLGELHAPQRLRARIAASEPLRRECMELQQAARDGLWTIETSAELDTFSGRVERYLDDLHDRGDVPLSRDSKGRLSSAIIKARSVEFEIKECVLFEQHALYWWLYTGNPAWQQEFDHSAERWERSQAIVAALEVGTDAAVRALLAWPGDRLPRERLERDRLVTDLTGRQLPSTLPTAWGGGRRA